MLRTRLIFVAAILCTSCASDRYLGSVGRDNVYSNRGFGMTIDPRLGGLEHRWLIIDPKNVEAAPPEMRPSTKGGLLDLNGDGELGLGEDVKFARPTLRLLSTTSTGTFMDVDVQILGGANAEKKPETIIREEIRRMSRTKTSTQTLQKTLAGPDYVTMTAEFPIRRHGAREEVRMSVIDQPYFAGEDGVQRRQVVFILLVTPHISTELRADHQYLTKGVVLSKFGAPPTSKERW